MMCDKIKVLTPGADLQSKIQPREKTVIATQKMYVVSTEHTLLFTEQCENKSLLQKAYNLKFNTGRITE